MLTIPVDSDTVEITSTPFEEYRAYTPPSTSSSSSPRSPAGQGTARTHENGARVERVNTILKDLRLSMQHGALIHFWPCEYEGYKDSTVKGVMKGWYADEKGNDAVEVWCHQVHENQWEKYYKGNMHGVCIETMVGKLYSVIEADQDTPGKEYPRLICRWFGTGKEEREEEWSDPVLNEFMEGRRYKYDFRDEPIIKVHDDVDITLTRREFDKLVSGQPCKGCKEPFYAVPYYESYGMGYTWFSNPDDETEVEDVVLDWVCSDCKKKVDNGQLNLGKPFASYSCADNDAVSG